MSPIVNLLVTFFLGGFGVHKFIEHKTGLGLLYLFTCGLFGIGWLWDTVKAARACFQKSKTVSAQSPDSELDVAGTYYHQSEIRSLVRENPEWNSPIPNGSQQRIFQFKTARKTATLVPEPENPNDPNAVRVDINGMTVGYIGREENREVLRLIKKHPNLQAQAFIFGGPYKNINFDGSVFTTPPDKSIEIRLNLVK